MTTSTILRVLFDKWFQEFFILNKHIDTYVDLAQAFRSFYQGTGMQISTKMFRELIEYYCRVNHYSYNPRNAKGFHKESNRILMKVNAKVVEFIYIGLDDTVINNKTFQVLIDYPGSDFQKGQIIEVIEGRFTVRIKDVECSFDLDYFLKYPDIFKEL